MAQTKNKRPFYSEDEEAVNAVRERFLKVNNERLKTVQQSLKVRQRIFLDILPLLIHFNDARLPGFVGDDCPIGIYDYQPSKKSSEAAKALVKGYADKRTPMREYHIYALYLIGSAGTIAYTDKSDLDVWVCHRADMSVEAITLLQSKCEKLSQWAATLDLEANFFVLTPESIREGDIETLSEESSGSAQHLLLVEEFYRTGLLLSGRIPAWWLVPPDHENNYYQHLEKLLSNKVISEHDIIDFGDVTTISPAEYYGAALWQLNKAIYSPYKSILKLQLMETYASEFPRTDLLCTRLKREIYDGETNIDKLDSYVLMIDKLNDYFSQHDTEERLQLARRCFYFKVHEWLTDNTQHARSRTHEIMLELTQKWQWTHDDLILLDSRETWKIDRVLEERRILVNELTSSYRLLTDITRQHTQETNITQEDLNILGRRLYSAFERKVGKIELINPGISIDLSEQRLCFVHMLSDNTPTWLLYRGNYQSAREHKQSPIKRTQSLIEMVAWCHFNGILGEKTVITLQNNLKGFTSQEILELIDTFRNRFPEGSINKASVEQLSKPAEIINSAVFINLGTDPMAQHTQRGLQLTSNRSDALSFGGRWRNLIQTCSSIVITSWGEVLTQQYDGDMCLLECLTDMLAWTPVGTSHLPSIPSTYCFAQSHGNSISRRASKLFEDITLYFYKNQWRETARYILRVDRRYAFFELENDVPRYHIIENDAELTHALSQPSSSFAPYFFDRHETDNVILKLIQRYNKPDNIQLFYLDRNQFADIYILDENGSLFRQAVEYYDIPTMLGHYRHFFDEALKRKNMSITASLNDDKSVGYQFYPIKKSLDEGYHIDLKSKTPVSAHRKYFDIQVIGDIRNINNDSFHLYCNGVEFSNLEFGNNVLREAVKYILDKRNTGERYPIYITDIDTNQVVNKHDLPIQTVQLLTYKKHIEDQLNQTLRSL